MASRSAVVDNPIGVLNRMWRAVRFPVGLGVSLVRRCLDIVSAAKGAARPNMAFVATLRYR
jgi:hypothetical protein